MTETITVYITIGNSDDKLTQNEWANFCASTSYYLRTYDYTHRIHGYWLSASDDPWQSACWCAEVFNTQELVDELKSNLAQLAGSYSQDSIAFAVAHTEFIRPA